MVPEVTLILNQKLYIVINFQFPIFINDEVRRGVTLIRRISWLLGLRGIGLKAFSLKLS